MDKLIDEYIRFFMTNFPYFENDLEQYMKYWNTEEPLTILIFSRIGSSVLKNFDKMNEKEKKILFKHIEKGMISDSENLSIAVATGLIEAIVNRTNDDDEVWKKIVELLGEKSLRHALAWRNFG